MKPLELKVDEGKIFDFISKNALESNPLFTNDFMEYKSYGMRTAMKAQELRQRTLGRAEDVQKKNEKDNPLGFYFLKVESTMIEFANSSSYIYAMTYSGTTLDSERISRSAKRRTSEGRTGTIPREKGEEGVASNVALHYECLRRLTESYNAGIKMSIEDPEIRKGNEEMLSYIKKGVEKANRVMGKGGFFSF
jgi:hypothetical protein